MIVFESSIMVCNNILGYGNNSASKNANYKYMLLCEAALGKIRVKHSARYYYNPYTNSNSQVNYVSFIDQNPRFICKKNTCLS